MSEIEFKHTCFMCGSKFRYGLHVYDGQHIPQYQITVCRLCYEGNWDGWAPHLEEKLLKHIKKKGLQVPKRNEKGLFPRD